MVDKQREAFERAEELGLVEPDEAPFNNNQDVPEVQSSKHVTDEAFCDALGQATNDENNAQGEYQRLESLARGAGLDNEADAIQMISSQENTHRKFFNKLRKRQC